MEFTHFKVDSVIIKSNPFLFGYCCCNDFLFWLDIRKENEMERKEN